MKVVEEMSYGKTCPSPSNAWSPFIGLATLNCQSHVPDFDVHQCNTVSHFPL